MDAYDYAGCLTAPRVLWLERTQGSPPGGAQGSLPGTPCPGGWALHQQPLPELTQLRHPDPARRWVLREELAELLGSDSSIGVYGSTPYGHVSAGGFGVGAESAGVIVDGGARLGLPRVGGQLLDVELVMRVG